MIYEVKILESVVKEFKKMDKQTVRIIKNWIVKNLVDTDNPRNHGKALAGNLSGIWRYRIGDYRLFAKIDDKEIKIFLFDIGHRSKIYRKNM